MDARGIPPTYPFHLAKAYSPAKPQARPAPGPRVPSGDTVEVSGKRPKAVNGLVAGKVSVAPNFSPTPAPASSDALPMYRHPADKNAAATGVSLGRGLDVQG
jgi:hypothetical protein